MSALGARGLTRPLPRSTKGAPQRPVSSSRVARSTSAGSSNHSQAAILDLLNHVAAGSLGPSDAAERLQALQGPGANPPSTSRPEVIFGANKSAEQLVSDLQRVAQTQGVVLATRVDADIAAQVEQLLPDVQVKDKARMLVYRSPTVALEKLPGAVAMIAAGSANEAVVEECRTMLQSLGCYCFTLGQAGVMGMHRMVQNIEAIRAADVVVVVTGADGSMVSVVAGMVDTPVIALPTSSGYGAALAGVTPLLSSLNSAAPGVTVVNIDSGVGASMAAWRILRNAAKFRKAAAGQS